MDNVSKKENVDIYAHKNMYTLHLHICMHENEDLFINAYHIYVYIYINIHMYIYIHTYT